MPDRVADVTVLVPGTGGAAGGEPRPPKRPAEEPLEAVTQGAERARR